MATIIADSEAAAVQTAMIREYGNLCATNESLAKERDRLRAEVARLDSEKPWLKEANATNADLRAEVERLRECCDKTAALCGKFITEDDGTDLTPNPVRIGSALQRLTARAERAEAELAAERARLDDLVADLNDACITLASAKDDCDDYALLNTGFKLEAVRDVLLQYIPNAAMKEGA
jgi:cell division protein FtsB